MRNAVLVLALVLTAACSQTPMDKVRALVHDICRSSGYKDGDATENGNGSRKGEIVVICRTGQEPNGMMLARIMDLTPQQERELKLWWYANEY